MYHYLPVRRVHKAMSEADRMAKEHGVDQHFAQQLAERVIAIFEHGSTRGLFCPKCGEHVFEDTDQQHPCRVPSVFSGAFMQESELLIRYTVGSTAEVCNANPEQLDVLLSDKPARSAEPVTQEVEV